MPQAKLVVLSLATIACHLELFYHHVFPCGMAEILEVTTGQLNVSLFYF